MHQVAPPTLACGGGRTRNVGRRAARLSPQSGRTGLAALLGFGLGRLRLLLRPPANSERRTTTRSTARATTIGAEPFCSGASGRFLGTTWASRQTRALTCPVAFGCCTDRGRLCDRCVADELAHLRGVAACRGEAWATSVASRIATRDPWPAFEGRARDLARTKTEDLGPDERLHEQLARICNEWAARRWAELHDHTPIVASRYVVREGRQGTRRGSIDRAIETTKAKATPR